MGSQTGRRNSSTSRTRRAILPAEASSVVVPSRRPPLLQSPTPTSIKVKAAGKNGKQVRTTSSKRHDHDVEAVRRKMEALRRLVPSDDGGDEVVDELLLLRAAAGYIARLQAQVRVMQLMVDVLEHAAQDD